MFTTEDLNDSVRAIVREVLGLGANDVRPADKNAPAGAKNEPYATVKIASITSEGVDAISYSKQYGLDWLAFAVDFLTADDTINSNTINENIYGIRRVLASVNFYRGDAYYNATRLKTLLNSSYAAAKMQAAGLGFIRASDAKDLTAFMDTLAEARGQLDIEFYAVAGERLPIETYGRFPIAVDNSNNIQSTEVFEP